MNTAMNSVVVVILCCVAPTLAAAQQSAANPQTAAKPTAQSEAGEPRADTSSVAAASPATPVAPAKAPTLGTAPAKAPTTTTTGATAPAAIAAADRASAPSGTAAPPHAAIGPATAASRTLGVQGAKAAGATDRLQLGTATVTGSQEQPKVMYIVPWKRSDIGDLAGKPMNSLVDEILAPVDREVFKREVVYYQAVQADASQNAAPPKSTQQGEK